MARWKNQFAAVGKVPGGRQRSDLWLGDFNTPPREEFAGSEEADTEGLRKSANNNEYIEKVTPEHIEIKLDGPSRGQPLDGGVVAWSQLDRIKILAHPSDLLDFDPSGITLEKHNLLTNALSDHIPIQLMIRDRALMQKRMRKIPAWAAIDSKYKAIMEKELTQALTLQVDNDPFTQLAVYKEALFKAWQKFQKSRLEDDELHCEKDEHYQHCLVLAWRAVNGRGDRTLQYT